MPATIRSLSEGPPGIAVIDSSFLFLALLDPMEHDGRYEACSAFLDKMYEADSILVVSPLLFLEAPAAWRRLYARGALPAPASVDDEASRRRRAFEQATESLRELLRQFETYEVVLDQPLLDAATAIAGQYNLNGHDALHVAVARRTEVSDVVTADRDFNRVDGLVVWQLRS